MNIELGISSFGETTPLETTGKAISHDQRIRDLLEEIVLADKLNIDAFAIGEHHRKDFAISAPEIILAAAASKTKQIHLSSATTNLPTINPIRVYEQYATMDAIRIYGEEVVPKVKTYFQKKTEQDRLKLKWKN